MDTVRVYSVLSILFLAAVAAADAADEDPAHVMVATGYSGSAMDDVEIVNVGPGDQTCMDPADYPAFTYYSSGVFLDGKVRMCGGSLTPTDCYEYNLGDDAWAASDYSPPVSMSLHESFLLANGSWLMVGGRSEGSTVIYSDGVMEQGPDLPVYLPFPVGAAVNSSHIFLAGGYNYYAGYLVDVDSWEFTALPYMLDGRWDFMCGLVKNMEGETELVVAGGDRAESAYNSVEIFNFGRWEWREGPRLPQPITQGETAQLSETFLILGGSNSGGRLDAVYEFDNVNYGWILRDERLQRAREHFVAISLPNEWDVC